MNKTKIANQFFLNDDKRDKLFFGGIALALFFVLLLLAERVSFWNDEMSQIAFGLNDIPYLIERSASLEDGVPPLFGIVAWFWYRIVPYGERWLLLLSIVPVVVSAYFLGLIGKLTVNARTGYIMEILFAASPFFWYNIALEFRGYSFLLLFSVLSIYLYLLRNQGKRKKGILGLNITLTALCFSHYFGIMIFGILFLADVMLLLRKKIKFMDMLSHAVPAILTVSWLAYVLIRAFRKGASAFMAWQPVPSLSHLSEAFFHLAGNRKWPLLFFALCIAVQGLSMLKGLRKNEFSWKRFYLLLAAVMCISNIGVIYVYGHYINTVNTMWSTRYFFGLIPFMLLVCAAELDECLTVFEKSSVSEPYPLAIIILLSILMMWKGAKDFRTQTVEPFREAAQWLSAQEDLLEDDTLVLCSEYGSCMEGWKEYYFNHYLEHSDALKLYSGKYSFTPLPEGEQKEKLAPYSKVYYSEIHRPDSAIREMLEREFTKTEEHADTRITVYER